MTQLIIFGETLFDCFTNAEPFLGGAPLNVAWHLKGLGLNPTFISSVGNDTLGQQAKHTMRRWGMNVKYIHGHDNYSTGRVDIGVNNGEPCYSIQDHVAYDHIPTPQLTLDKNALIYHGSLVFRHPQNQHSLNQLIHNSTLKRFIDINLRVPWWDKKSVLKNIQHAAFVKMNSEEFHLLNNHKAQEANIKNAENFRHAHNIKTLVITCGDQPSIHVNQDGEQFVTDPIATPVVTTVGAGDAFTAICILGEIHHWPWPLRIERAHHFASVIIQEQGAITNNVNIYTGLAEDWGLTL